MNEEMTPRYSLDFHHAMARKRYQNQQQLAHAFEAIPMRLAEAIADAEIESSAPLHHPSREDRRHIMRMVPAELQLQREIAELEKQIAAHRGMERYREPWWLLLLRWIESRL